MRNKDLHHQYIPKEKIIDLYNAYNSQLKEAMVVKLGRKEYRTEEIIKLEAKVELLKKLLYGK